MPSTHTPFSAKFFMSMYRPNLHSVALPVPEIIAPPWVPPIISVMGKATNFKLARYIHRVDANKSPLKIWENRERGRIQGLPNFLKYPLLSHEWVKQSYKRQIWQIYSEGPCEQKPIKNLGENGAWVYTGTAQIFGVPRIISGTGKATNFNFCTHILSIDRCKSPLQTSGKVAGCVVRTLKTFQGTHILGASRGLLCDSSAVLLCVRVQWCSARLLCSVFVLTQHAMVNVEYNHWQLGRSSAILCSALICCVTCDMMMMPASDVTLLWCIIAMTQPRHGQSTLYTPWPIKSH